MEAQGGLVGGSGQEVGAQGVGGGLERGEEGRGQLGFRAPPPLGPLEAGTQGLHCLGPKAQGPTPPKNLDF